ncbi:MAG: OmpA family protein [Chitinispirillaceae bacterium]|nr:OmpA family protein [Chitinispirillaceae bacterium]
MFKHIWIIGAILTVPMGAFAAVSVLPVKAPSDTVQPLGAAAPVKTSADTALPPATSIWATRGLTQTVSAEPMGDGRLNISFTPTWYAQEGNLPLQKAHILTGIFAFCYGLSAYVDIFGNAAGYGILADSSRFGKGNFSLGLRGTLPLHKLSPLRLGVQMAFIAATSSRRLNENNFDGTYFPYNTNSDGYDYFETETSYDFVGRFIETLVFGGDSLGIKLHFNQGAAMLLQNGNRQLLLLGAGIQASVNPKIALGLEFNSRTNVNNLHNQTDPLWLTPSILFRTPYHFNTLLGADISCSKERDWVGNRALEPFRLFGSIAFSFDLLEKKRCAEREKTLREKAEWEQQIKTMQKRGEVIASMARVDSSARANAIDSLKRRNTQLVQLAGENAARIDDLKRKLELERSRRSDAEKNLLSTGMLLLDAVYFETGRSQISINSYPYLNIIGKMLSKYPKLQIEIAGHTDNTGKYDKNITLSQARAESVRRYLIQVAPDLLTRLNARGYGPTQPKATNKTREGRKLNRRTELQVLNKEVLNEYR